MADAVYAEIVYFSGRVQGVGVRYETCLIARGFEVSGFVQNLSDGRVLLEAEGEESEVCGFVGEISHRMESFIRDCDRRPEPRPRRHQGFTIRR